MHTASGHKPEPGKAGEGARNVRIHSTIEPAHVHIHSSHKPCSTSCLENKTPFFLLPILIPQVLLNWPVYTGTKQAEALKFKTPANEVGKNQCAAVIHTAIQDCPSVKIMSLLIACTKFSDFRSESLLLK